MPATDFLPLLLPPQALATDVSGNPPFSTLVKERVRKTCLGAYEHSMVPTAVVSGCSGGRRVL